MSQNDRMTVKQLREELKDIADQAAMTSEMVVARKLANIAHRVHHQAAVNEIQRFETCSLSGDK